MKRLLWLALCFVPGFLAQAEPPPNIILIVADDLGREAISAYGSTSCSTPNLDRLAREGMRFNHVYTNPLSTASRVKLLTGKSSHRNYRGLGLLPEGACTIANVLQYAGYRTGICGKWQLGGDAASVTNFGFSDHRLWYLSEVGSRYWNPTLSERGATIPVSEKEFGPNLVNAYAKQFVRSPKPEPFFLLYSMVLPHWPFVPTPDSGPGGQRERTDAYQQRLGGEEYFPDMVAYLDRLVGQLVAQLRTLGIEKETLILFTSDNGCARNIISEKGDELIPGGYGTLTDPGTRVPMIAWWPGKIRAGGVCDDLIDFSDILPTLAEIGGHAVPESSIVDGKSFAAQLKGLPAQSRDMVLCDSFSEPIAEPEDVAEKRAYLKKVEHQVRVKMAGRFVRSKRYKLYADERFYDMQNDPEEERELQRFSAEAGAAKEFLEEGLATLPPWSPFLVGPRLAEPHPVEE